MAGLTLFELGLQLVSHVLVIVCVNDGASDRNGRRGKIDSLVPVVPAER